MEKVSYIQDNKVALSKRNFLAVAFLLHGIIGLFINFTCQAEESPKHTSIHNSKSHPEIFCRKQYIAVQNARGNPLMSGLIIDH